MSLKFPPDQAPDFGNSLKPGRDGQLALELPHAQSSSLDDFVRGSSNAKALDFVLDWPQWPQGGAVLVGPAGSGKSHLARIWAVRSNARMIFNPKVDITPLLREDRLCAVVEDLDRVAFDETALFLLFNHCQESGGALLVTARERPARIAVALQDLASRLRAARLIEIDEPDDALIEAVLVKLFSDRQLDIAQEIVSYAGARMERSLAGAIALVSRIDQRSLEEGRRVTKPLVSRVLDEISRGRD